MTKPQTKQQNPATREPVKARIVKPRKPLPGQLTLPFDTADTELANTKGADR